MTVDCTSERVSAMRVRAREQCVPLTALVELTHRCNLGCRHCYLVHDREPELTTAEVFGLIEQLEAAGTLFLHLTGGEIMLRDDLWEIIGFAREHNFAVALLTNGTLVDETAADRIAELGVLEVSVSVYAHVAEVHDAQTRVGGSFDAATRALRLLSDRGIAARLKCVLMEMNVAHVAEITELARELGVVAQFDPQLSPRNDGDRTPLQFMAEDAALVEVLIEDRATQSLEQFLGEAPCSAGRDMVSIGPSGTVYPCIQMPLAAGSVRSSAFGEIWSRSANLAEVRQFRMSQSEQCVGCGSFRVCRPCLGLNVVENGELSKPASTTCRLARLREEVLHHAQGT